MISIFPLIAFVLVKRKFPQFSSVKLQIFISLAAKTHRMWIWFAFILKFATFSIRFRVIKGKEENCENFEKWKIMKTFPIEWIKLLNIRWLWILFKIAAPDLVRPHPHNIKIHLRRQFLTLMDYRIKMGLYRRTTTATSTAMASVTGAPIVWSLDHRAKHSRQQCRLFIQSMIFIGRKLAQDSSRKCTR